MNMSAHLNNMDKKRYFWFWVQIGIIGAAIYLVDIAAKKFDPNTPYWLRLLAAVGVGYPSLQLCNFFMRQFQPHETRIKKG